MATPESIAIERAKAEDRIAAAAEAIAKAVGVDPPTIESAHPMSPYPAELGAALYAKGIATYLEAVALAVAPAEDLDLEAMTRAELDELALAHGVEDPTDYPNKDALIAAIATAATATEDTTVNDEKNPTRHADAEGDMQPLDKPAAHAPDSGSIADKGGDFGATTPGDAGVPASGMAPDPADLVPESPKNADKAKKGS